jgi:hypothetical protein
MEKSRLITAADKNLMHLYVRTGDTKNALYYVERVLEKTKKDDWETLGDLYSIIFYALNLITSPPALLQKRGGVASRLLPHILPTLASRTSFPSFSPLLEGVRGDWTWGTVMLLYGGCFV